MGKQYTCVVDMTRDILGDEFADSLQKRIEARKRIDQLMAKRALKDLSAADVAKLMRISLERMVSLEEGTDEEAGHLLELYEQAVSGNQR